MGFFATSSQVSSFWFPLGRDKLVRLTPTPTAGALTLVLVSDVPLPLIPPLVLLCQRVRFPIARRCSCLPRATPAAVWLKRLPPV